MKELPLQRCPVCRSVCSPVDKNPLFRSPSSGGNKGEPLLNNSTPLPQQG